MNILVCFPSSYKDNSQFETKADCQNILTLTCDLSNETALDYNEQYLALVLVNNQLHGYSTRFKPTAHSKSLFHSVAVNTIITILSFQHVSLLVTEAHLGPPVLSTSTSTSSLHVNVTLPLGPNNISIGDIISGSRSSHSKTDIIYTLRITEPAWAAHVSLHFNAVEFCCQSNLALNVSGFTHFPFCFTESQQHKWLLCH